MISEDRDSTDRDDGVFIQHPGNDKDEVMADVLDNFPWETFYFLNEGLLRERARLFKNNFLPGNPQSAVAYAIKANPRRRILEILSEEGVDHFDCASPNEIALARDVNPDSTALYNNPNKTPCDIQEAALLGCHHFTVQTREDLATVLENARYFIDEENLEIAVRLQTLNDMADINLSTKFGGTRDNVRQIISSVCKDSSAAAGISVHTGSQNRDPNQFVQGIKKMADVVARGNKLKTINIGGGLPANYSAADKFDIENYLRVITDAINHLVLDLLQDDGKIIIEPGRSMVAESVDLVVPVISRERRNSQDCVTINDAVFGSFSPLGDPPSFNAPFDAMRKTSTGLQKLPSSPLQEYMLFGKTCDSADELGVRQLPSGLRNGDWLFRSSAGAYTNAYATNFCFLGQPKWVSYNT